MKIIEFKDTEIEELKNFYKHEREKTIEKLDIINGILNKINASEKTKKENAALITHATKKTIGHEEQIKPQKRNTSKTRKSKWFTLILGLLKQRNYPITFNDIIKEAIYKYNIPIDKFKNVKASLINCIFRLKTFKKKIRNIKIPGKKQKYIGLSTWFDKNGELKEEYKKKLTSITENPETPISITKKEIKSKPKAIWVPFVLNTIKEHNTLLQRKELTNIAMEKFKIDYKKAKTSVLSSVKDQEFHTKKLKSYVINGIIGKYYGLPEWFYRNGQLKEEYKKKLTSITENPETPISITKKEIK